MSGPALLCALVGAFACTSVAQAEPPKLISYGSFNSGRFPLGVAVDNSCVLHTPALTGEACTTFDPSAGDVYVAGFILSKINKFDSSNALQAPPSPFGAGSGRYSGAVVNPTNGTVYVLDAAASEIDPYDPITGALVETAAEKPFPVPPSGNFFNGQDTVVQIGADSAGNVYVPEPFKKTEKSPSGSGEYEYVPNDEVLEYSPTGTPLKTFTGGAGAGKLKEPTGVAVDSSGNLWVADTGDNRIEELTQADSAIGEIKSEGVQTVALDGRGDVLAIVKNNEDACGSLHPPCSHLVEYDSAGARVADVGAGSFEGGGGFVPLPPMVAFNEVNGRAYVTSASLTGTSLVFIFGPPTAPIVNNELTAEVTTSEAKLGALVNPGGLAATFRFEYDTREYREGEGPHGTSVPLPEGSVGEGLESHPVWAAASGLAPGATYHYRVVATNEVGTAYGPDETFTTLTAAQASCLNNETRVGFSTRLPDCRAYELVTPPVANSAEVNLGIKNAPGGGELNVAYVAAPDGDAISFATNEPLPGAPSSGATYLARRGASGWTSEDVVPLESYSGALCSAYGGQVRAYSEDMSKLIVIHGMYSRGSYPNSKEEEAKLEDCNAQGMQVLSEEPVGYWNLLLRDNEAGSYRLVNFPEPGLSPVPADARFQGASADLSHVVFSEQTPLTSTAAYGVESLYEWDEGTVRLVSVLPDGSPAGGSVPSKQPEAHAVSSDGSHVVFTSGGGLYVRVDARRTVQIDESRVGSVASGGGVFQAASAGGSTIFFTDERRLTADSTAETGEPDLYECVLPEGASRCELSDLTAAGAGEHADVLNVSVPSSDSSHVYFVAKAVLAGNERDYVSPEGGEVKEKAQGGQKNLYLWDGKAVTFIATVDENDEITDWVHRPAPDGEWYAFVSRKSLTGYDNVVNVVEGTFTAKEIFLYSAESNRIVCVSCNPSGQAPVAQSILGSRAYEIDSPRLLFDGGRLFFHTAEALVPSDTNGQEDVYEYEDGHVSLISSGTSASPAYLVNASENGEDVFFAVAQQLVPQDTQPGVPVIYDARVDGGFPAVATPPPCSTVDACRVPVSPEPSIYGAPASQTFSGAGNLALTSPAARAVKAKPKALTCRRGFVRKKVKLKSRCVKKPTRKARKTVHAKKRGH